VSDINHAVVAAASSSSVSRAQQFLQACKCASSAKAYGGYAELVADPDVDIVYVATPHSHHFQNTMLCLEAGKPVLCEKPFTVNAAQAEKLYETAKSKGLFLMEAVWTRYFPLSVAIRKMIQDGEIGAVHRTIADLSFYYGETWDAMHRMVNKELAGGAMLDCASCRPISRSIFLPFGAH
jgi:predicted dehydrogenase